MYNPMFFEVLKKMFKGFYYNVQENENLEILSKRYKVAVNDIINVNNLTYPYAIKEGDVLFIPGIDEPIAPNRGSIYTVKFGDTIENIAEKYSLSAEEIMKSNFINSKVIFVGQKLLIPATQNNNTKQLSESEENMEFKEEKLHNDNEPVRIYPRVTDESKYDYIKNIGKKFPVMKRGYRGKEVVTFQRLLSALGYSMRRSDDTFGSDLERKVIDIQNKAGLEPNGIVDEKMWEYVFSRVNKTPVTFR